MSLKSIWVQSIDLKLHDLNHGAPLQIELWSPIIKLWRTLPISMYFLCNSMQLWNKNKALLRKNISQWLSHSCLCFQTVLVCVFSDVFLVTYLNQVHRVSTITEHSVSRLGGIHARFNIMHTVRNGWWEIDIYGCYLLVKFANLRMQEQSTNMTSQCQYLTFAWCHKQATVMQQCLNSKYHPLGDKDEITDR